MRVKLPDVHAVTISERKYFSRNSNQCFHFVCIQIQGLFSANCILAWPSKKVILNKLSSDVRDRFLAHRIRPTDFTRQYSDDALLVPANGAGGAGGAGGASHKF